MQASLHLHLAHPVEPPAQEVLTVELDAPAAVHPVGNESCTALVLFSESKNASHYSAHLLSTVSSVVASADPHLIDRPVLLNLVLQLDKTVAVDLYRLLMLDVDQFHHSVDPSAGTDT